jgi:hypothetical protein
MTNVSEEPTTFCTEDGGTRFLRNVGNYLLEKTVSQPASPFFTAVKNPDLN